MACACACGEQARIPERPTGDVHAQEVLARDMAACVPEHEVSAPWWQGISQAPGAGGAGACTTGHFYQRRQARLR